MTVVVPVHTDDGIMIGNKPLIDWLCTRLEAEFKIKWNTVPRMYLGMRVDYRPSEGVAYLDQAHYIREVLAQFGLEQAHPVSTPGATEPLVETTDNKVAAAVGKPYAALVGSLQWIAICTRPDIARLTNKLLQFLRCPGIKQWSRAVRIARYLKGTIHLRLALHGVQRSASRARSAQDAQDLDLQPSHREQM